MSKRCSCYAVTTRHICKKKFSFIIQNKRFCHIHARYEFNKYALLIQKYWVGYRARCMMKNVYTKLPDELQRKILFYVRENYLIKKHHHDVISKILDAKLDRVWLLSVVNSLRTSDIIYQSKNLQTVAQIYYLFTKYFTIAPPRKLMLLENCVANFRHARHAGPFYNNNSEIVDLISTYINPFRDKMIYINPFRDKMIAVY